MSGGTSPQSVGRVVRHVLVVVPVRDEAERVGACLASIGAAVAAAGLTLRDGPGGTAAATARIVAVLDSCTDGSAAIIHEMHPEVVTITTTAGRVGPARARGVAGGLALTTHSATATWIANTDADSIVPENWLSHQLDLAGQGVDVVRGLVDPHRSECGDVTYDRWLAEYLPGPGHPHVHGANLGVRASAYLRCGGFADDSVHEDVRLVRRAEAAGLLVVGTNQAVVTTSGRTRGRVTGASFADYLRTCAA